MEEFKFSCFARIMCITCIVLMSYILILISKVFPELFKQLDILYSCLTILLFIFFLGYVLYILNVFITISCDKFKSVAIDVLSEVFLIKCRNKGIIKIPFSDVVNVSMYSGCIMRGMETGHIIIQTRDNKMYCVTISSFLAFLSKIISLYVKKNLASKLWYNPDWNKISKYI